MSIIIHFSQTPTILSSTTVPPAPTCVVDAETSLDMVPALENDSGLSRMSPDDSSMVDVSTSELYSGKVHGSHHTFGSCFGLPYQDHNYGAPPPPTPPSHSPQMSPVHLVNTVLVKTEPLSSLSTTVFHKEEAQETSITRCVCGFDHDDEYMICCDRCLVWQHVDCMGLDRNKIPETYLCEKCEPRRVDRQKAKVLQAKKKVAMTGKKLIFQDTSDESEEDGNRKIRRFELSSKTRTKSSKRKMDDEKDIKNEHAVRKGRSNSKHGKERMEIKRSKFRRRTKSKSESACVGDEEAQDAWKCSETDDNIESSSDIQNIGATLRSQTEETKASKQLQAQLCRLVEFSGNQKKLVAATNLSRDQIIVEFKGQFVSATQFHQKNPVFRQKEFPFVLFYKLRSHEELCVDASENGNDARFVRRSCLPNAEIRHLVSNGALHLYISSIKDIFKDEEITIPFDVNFKDCLHEVECACNSDTCFLTINRKNGGSESKDASEKRKRGRKLTLSTDDESNQSLVDSIITSPTKINKVLPLKASSPMKAPPSLSSLLEEPSESQPVSEEHLTEDYHMREQCKKMTREERKIDAIMRAFEQLEKDKKRKQQRQSQKPLLPKTEDGQDNKPEAVSPPIKEEEKQIITENSSSVDDEKPPPPPPPMAAQLLKQKKGKRRRCSGTPVRRRTRTSSGGSDIFITDDNASSACEIPVPSLPPTPIIEAPPEPVFPEPVVGTTLSLSPPCLAPVPVLPKTKRFLHNEWLHEKESTVMVSSPPAMRTEINYNVLVANPTCYVRCTKDAPGASGISAAHLRRSSFTGHGKTPTNQSVIKPSSAKKRWLRQALYDCVPLDGDSSGGISMEVINGEISSPSHTICYSPGGHSEITMLTTDDVVTPLKKRRLLRKSIESCSSSEWMGASSELSPDNSSCDSTKGALTDIANIKEELKHNFSPQRKSKKGSKSKVNGYSPHMLKLLRQSWIENDSKSQVTDPTEIEGDSQNSLDSAAHLAIPKNCIAESENSSVEVEASVSKQLDFEEKADDLKTTVCSSVSDSTSQVTCSVATLSPHHKPLKISEQNKEEENTVTPHDMNTICIKSSPLSNGDSSHNQIDTSVKDPDIPLPAKQDAAALSSTENELLPTEDTSDRNHVTPTNGVTQSPKKMNSTSDLTLDETNAKDNKSYLHKESTNSPKESTNSPKGSTNSPKESNNLELNNLSKESNNLELNNLPKESSNLPTESTNAQTSVEKSASSDDAATVKLTDNSTLPSDCTGPLYVQEKVSNPEPVKEMNEADVKALNCLPTAKRPHPIKRSASESPQKSSTPTPTTPKRKVSLSEYRQRKRENPSPVGVGSSDKKKSNNCVLSAVRSLEASFDSEIKLAALPLFESLVNKTDQSGTDETKSPKKDASPLGGEQKKDSEPRENLTERLKREFGLVEDSDKKDKELKHQMPDGGMMKGIPAMTPMLSLCNPLPPPPPTPGAPMDIKNPSQFSYLVSTPYAQQQQYNTVPQITSNQYMAPQLPVNSQIMPVINAITVPSGVPPVCNYSATMQTNVSRPPQPTYPVANNQSYPVLAQQGTHAALQQSYHPLFKSRVYK